MPFPIDFEKSKGAYFIDCLAEGKPIEGVRTVNEMLASAGACFFCAQSHGPIRLSDKEWEKIPEEHREAGWEQLSEDLLGAIEFYGYLTQLVRDDQYDERCEPHIEAIISKSEGEKTFHPLKGFHNSEGPSSS